jgi:hypothetical protein
MPFLVLTFFSKFLKNLKIRLKKSESIFKISIKSSIILLCHEPGKLNDFVDLCSYRERAEGQIDLERMTLWMNCAVATKGCERTKFAARLGLLPLIDVHGVLTIHKVSVWSRILLLKIERSNLGEMQGIETSRRHNCIERYYCSV